jgi:hypothetical protein
MSESDIRSVQAMLEGIRAHALTNNVRITQHAQQEMAEEDITLDEVLQSIASAQLLENYPEHRRGPCCLLSGRTTNSRPVHIVCTTAQAALIIITVYEPKPPKWVTPTQRRQEG